MWQALRVRMPGRSTTRSTGTGFVAATFSSSTTHTIPYVIARALRAPLHGRNLDLQTASTCSRPRIPKNHKKIWSPNLKRLRRSRRLEAARRSWWLKMSTTISRSWTSSLRRSG